MRISILLLVLSSMFVAQHGLNDPNPETKNLAITLDEGIGVRYYFSPRFALDANIAADYRSYSQDPEVIWVGAAVSIGGVFEISSYNGFSFNLLA